MVRKRSSSASSSHTRKTLQPQTRKHIIGVAQICLGIILILIIRGEAGSVGLTLSSFLTELFGRWSIIFPVYLIVAGVFRTLTLAPRLEVKRSLGLLLCLLTFLGLMHIGAPFADIGPKHAELGGWVGFMVSIPFLVFFSVSVGYVVLTSLFFIGIFLSFEPDVAAIIHSIRLFFASEPERKSRSKVPEDATEVDETAFVDDVDDEEIDLVERDDAVIPELNIVRPSFAQSAVSSHAPASSPKAKEARSDALEMKDTRFEEWTFPSLELLEQEQSQLLVNDEELKKQARLIEEKLLEFGIEVSVRDARPGPTVTQFTLQPAEGVKLSRIGSLKDDLSLALAAQSLRIEAPIPGKSLVGIEMPNSHRTVVHLREILQSASFQQSQSSLTLPLGRDVSGESVVVALDDMPHVLIAGATGSGKSVCMNVFLTALLYQNAPHELKFILIDPKRVELMPYNGIPHLLTPVITEADKALQALRWAVAEMGRRLHRFSEQGARNIDEYNEKQTDESLLLPRIVVVIDELADLMMRQYRKDTETMIVRIAQMARAVGMHLIIATQRPSVDVITGLIKANVPTRFAFRVVSSVDSRTILDGIGAEDLLGKGDMLFMMASTPKPLRIQGIYVSTKEVERVINAVKIAGGGKVTEQIGLSRDDASADDANDDENDSPSKTLIDLDADDNGGDDMFFEAVAVVRRSAKASASLLQRQLKVGYARAARLLDIMEEKGLIGPADGAKPRKVFIPKEVTDSDDA